ncbi:hypothetical protein HK097_009798 [Rhizophlyctis rosea]|uniref:Uncharacterized protein n=1 Tax=Rhizophlyctis rosea TaxID=64517 RepID=A0AAD5SGD3_9FUNG|nr:hypothetical protein HK097_009798 [Rhizophlyctis rosea]
MHPTLLPNITSILLSIALLISYHAYLLHAVRNNPQSTLIGLTRKARRRWVKYMVKTNNAILAVQSLRNWLMTSTLLAGTAMTVCVGLLAVVAGGASKVGGGTGKVGGGLDDIGVPTFRNAAVGGAGAEGGFLASVGRSAGAVVPYAISGITHASQYNGTNWPSDLDLVVQRELFGLKIVILLICFTTSFFCFTQSMRYFNHVGIIIGLLCAEHQQSKSNAKSPPARRPVHSHSKHHFVQDHRLRHPPSVVSDDNVSENLGPASPARSRVGTVLDADEDEGYVGGGARAKRYAAVSEASDSDEEEEGLVVDVDKTAELLNRGAVFQTMGNRGYYLAIPCLLWFFGPWFLLSGTLLLVILLSWLDWGLSTASPSSSLPLMIRSSSSRGRNNKWSPPTQRSDSASGWRSYVSFNGANEEGQSMSKNERGRRGGGYGTLGEGY